MRILVVNPFGIGDVLFSTPLISNLKIAYPQSYIGYICNVRAKDVLHDNHQVDDVFVFEKDEYRRLWKKSKSRCIKKFISFLIRIKKAKFDLAIDLSLGYQYSLFLMFVGIKKRIGYNYRNRGRFLTRKIDITGYQDKPIVDYYLDLLRLLDVKPGRFNLTMVVPKSDQEWADDFFRKNSLEKQHLVIGIIPAGGASWGEDFSYRHWPWENYVRLSDKLIVESGAKVVIFGAHAETDICRRIEQAMQNKVVNVCGKTTLKQFAALLKKCKLVVCNDGGPLHIAVSQNVHTVSVFGPVDEKVYGPYSLGTRHITVTEDITCRPCYKRFKLPKCQRQRQCIRDISAERIYQIIKDILLENKETKI